MKTTKLKKLDACKSAIEFSKGFKTYKEVWENCPRGDWMLWLASRLKIDKRLLTLAKGKCAQTVLHLMKDERSRNAVQAAINFGEGLITEDELRTAADAAAYAAYAADAYAADAAAAYAADAAADAAAADAYAADAAAADAAAYAAYAAAAADDAAYAAYAADAAAAADDAKKTNQLLTANICREILTEAVYAKYKAL